MAVKHQGVIVKIKRKYYEDARDFLDRIFGIDVFDCAVSAVKRDGTVLHIGLGEDACNRIVVGNEYVLRPDGSLYSQRSGRVYR